MLMERECAGFKECVELRYRLACRWSASNEGSPLLEELSYIAKLIVVKRLHICGRCEYYRIAEQNGRVGRAASKPGESENRILAARVISL